MAVGARRVADAADDRGSGRARGPPHTTARSLGRVAFSTQRPQRERRGRREQTKCKKTPAASGAGFTPAQRAGRRVDAGLSHYLSVSAFSPFVLRDLRVNSLLKKS